MYQQTSNITRKYYSFKDHSNLYHRNVLFKVVFKFYVDITFRRESILNYFTVGHFCCRRSYQNETNKNISMSCFSTHAFKTVEQISSHQISRQLLGILSNKIDVFMFHCETKRAAIKLMSMLEFITIPKKNGFFCLLVSILEVSLGE